MAVYHKGKGLWKPLHDGNVISQIYYMGKKYIGWLSPTSIAVIRLAFGEEAAQVINSTCAYLNTIATTDPQRAQALAGFINEDPMMVCSLGLEPQGVTMPIRCLHGTGTLKSQTEFQKGSDLDVEIDFISYNSTAAWGPLLLQGADSGSNESIFLVGFNNSYTKGYAWIGANNYTQNFTYTIGERTKMRLKNKSGFWKNGSKVWSTTRQSSNLKGPLMMGNCGEVKFIAATCKDTLNGIDWNFVPFNDNGTICMIDLNGLQERMVIAEGSFTIALTPKTTS